MSGPMVDAERLMAWLAERRDVMKLPVTAAIYEGLRARIARGEFTSTDGGGED